MLSNYLGETTKQKVLGYLAKYPDKETYERQLARTLGISYGSAHRVLSELYCDKAIKQRREGKMFFYSIDRSLPDLKYFKILVNIGLIAPLAVRLAGVAQRVILFGSCARGEDDSASDMDLFIVTNRRKSIMRVIEEYQFAPGYQQVHIQPVIKTAAELLNADKADHLFFDEVEQGIVLWEATGNES